MFTNFKKHKLIHYFDTILEREPLSFETPNGQNYPIHRQCGAHFQRLLEICFAKWAKIVSDFPISTIILGSVLVLVTTIPITNIRITTDPIELWSSETSKGRIEKNYFDNNFAPFYRPTQIIIKNLDKDYFNHTFGNTSYKISSVFNQEFLEKVFALQNEITAITAQNGSIKLEDICFDPLSKGICVVQSVPGYFQANITRLKSKTRTYSFLDHLIACLRAPYSLDDNLEPFHYSCFASYGGPSLPNVALGGFAEPTVEGYLQSTSLIITLVINNHVDALQNREALAWEKEFLTFMKNLNTTTYSGLDLSYYSQRSVEDEIKRQSESDIWTILISYMVMFAYISVTLGQVTTGRELFVSSKIGLGLVGVTIVLASVFSSIGIMTFLGFNLTLIIMEVIPFLVLAVGVDNIFILVQNLQVNAC